MKSYMRKKMMTYLVCISLLVGETAFFIKADKELDKEVKAKKELSVDEDFILTVQEKGINLSNLSEEYIKKINDYVLIKEALVDEPIASFNIDEQYYNVYNNINIKSKIENHSNNEFYDKEKNEIIWDGLALKIYNNSLKDSKNDKFNKERRSYYDGLEPLSIKDIVIVLIQFKKVLARTLEENPHYDLAYLACKLSDMSLVYKTKIYKYEETMAASCSDNRIMWYVRDKKYPDFLDFSNLNYHELMHFLGTTCIDDKSNKVGLGIMLPYNSNKNNRGFLFAFIREWSAEKSASNITNLDYSVYLANQYIMDNIEFMLSLNDEYKINDIIKNDANREALEFINEFPNYSEDAKKYFVPNIKMLASFDTMLNMGSHYLYLDILKNNYPAYNNEYNAIFTNTINYAELQLSNLFLSNVIAMNDTHKNIDLEYNCYLLKLYSKSLTKTIEILEENTRTNYLLNESNDLEESYLDLTAYVLEYLSKKYNINFDKLCELYNDYELTDVTYPSFVTDDKQELYKKIEVFVKKDVKTLLKK